MSSNPAPDDDEISEEIIEEIIESDSDEYEEEIIYEDEEISEELVIGSDSERVANENEVFEDNESEEDGGEGTTTTGEEVGSSRYSRTACSRPKPPTSTGATMML